MSVREQASAGRQAVDEDLDAFVARHRRRIAGYARWALAWPVALFLVISLGVGADLAADVANGAHRVHIACELGVLLLALAGVLGTGLKLRTALRDGVDVLGELEIARVDLAHWRGETLRPPRR